jgi:hypothetical protein
VKSHHDLISLFAHDLRANALRLSRGKPASTLPDHALAARISTFINTLLVIVAGLAIVARVGATIDERSSGNINLKN